MGMEMHYAGWISLIPPILAIILAFITKEVIFSLFLASFIGSIIYECYDGGNIATVFYNLVSVICEKAQSEVALLVFILLMGGLVEVMKKSGSTKAYSAWISRIIKTKRSAQMCTFFLGVFLFVDDYFNCLSNGTVMKPVADTVGISNYKISYIIKGMAINCALIIPISSWGAAVTTQISLAGIDQPLTAFINSIPYISLPLLFFVFILILVIFNYDFGRMAAEEKYVEDHVFIKHETGDQALTSIVTPTEFKNKKCKAIFKPSVIDLVFPILFLIIMSILLMLWSGGFFNGVSIGEAFGNAETTMCLATATLLTLILCFIVFLPRRLMRFLTFMDAVKDGIADMMSTVLLLVLAWTLAGYSNDLLGTGTFIANFMTESNLPAWILPLIVYILSSVLSFALGNAWVTFSIFIPIAGHIITKVDPILLYATIGSCLSGSSFGELASPISDTTILTAAATGINTAEFTSACLQYNLFLGSISAISYIIYGINEGSFIISDCVCLCLLVIGCIVGRFLKVPKLKRKELANDLELTDVNLATKDIDTVSLDLETKMGEPIDVDVIAPNSDELKEYNLAHLQDAEKTTPSYSSPLDDLSDSVPNIVGVSDINQSSNGVNSVDLSGSHVQDLNTVDLKPSIITFSNRKITDDDYEDSDDAI